MDEREGEVWGFNYGSMYALKLNCIGLLKMSHKYGMHLRKTNRHY